MNDMIRIKGAREHNLKNISVDLPKNKLVVITGLSGSGKSSLAFDTLYAEGQRRYVESLSAYARQFLGIMNKPDVDSIEGLSPAISIDQKGTSKNPRSTVGTITEIYDYLRLLYARMGTPHCPVCNKVLAAQSTDTIVANSLKEFNGNQVTVYSPVVRGEKGTFEPLMKDLEKKGFSRVRIDGIQYNVTDKMNLNKYEKHDVNVVMDRFIVNAENESRLAEAIEKSDALSNGFVIVAGSKNEKFYSKKLACDEHNISFDELQPRMFSFNSPFGACEECHGLGFKQEFDEKLIVPDRNLSILRGAISLAGFQSLYGWRGQQLSTVAKHFGFNLNTPWKQLSKEQQKLLMHGSPEKIKFNYVSGTGDSEFSTVNYWEGIIPMQERIYKQTKSESRREEMESFMTSKKCPGCNGTRLKPLSRAVTVGGKNIVEVSDFTVGDLIGFFKELKISDNDFKIAKPVLKEIRDRLFFLKNVGLEYLTLSRSANTLSGGESQRIRLATQIGSNLTGVMYVLDEPSIGLHQRDNTKLIETLKKLRDLGNTVIVVEHDEETILEADFVLDIGPGAGIHGGQVLAIGTPQEVMNNVQSITGQYLKGVKKIHFAKQRRKPQKWLTIKKARANNLKGISAAFPIGCLTAVTGVSGSGKSTLINDTLYPYLANELNGAALDVGDCAGVEGQGALDKIINIDQSPIGRTPRSNPATYIGLWTTMRELFSQTKEAKLKGFGPGRFSFNVADGRCEKCEGNGTIKIEMNFLPDVYITCEDCKGTRFNKETLTITYKGKNISQVLEMTVEEATPFFANISAIRNKLEVLQQVGLGYVKLGQSSTTLSGGEAQRIKLTAELAKRGTGRTIYILDEPTTGLHFDDVNKLIQVLNSLVEKGNTVIVIEHNLDVVKTADWIIDLGPEGGNGGGEIVAEGTPEEIAKVKKSYTGQYLKKMLEKA